MRSRFDDGATTLSVSNNGSTKNTVQNKLLRTLEAHAGHIMTHDEMAKVLWSDDPPPSWRCLLAIYIGNIRSKVPSARARLVTVQNVGYMWSKDPLEEKTNTKKPTVKKVQVHGFRLALNKKADI